MINAGLNIKSFSGSQVFDVATSSWKGIKVSINYPPNQNRTNNAPSIGDTVIDQTGIIWNVEAVSYDGTANDYTLELSAVNFPKEEATQPDLGSTTRGSISTPVNSNIPTHWNATLVSNEVSRVANMRNSEQTPAPVDLATVIGTAPADADTLGEVSSLIDGLDSRVSTAETTLATKASTSALNTLDSRVTTAETTLATKASSADLNSAVELVASNFIIDVTNWSSDTWTLPEGWTAVKEYSGTSLKVTHNLNKIPSSWIGLNKADSPMSQIIPSSVRSMQVVDNNTVIFTQIGVSDTFTITVSI